MNRIIVLFLATLSVSGCFSDHKRTNESSKLQVESGPYHVNLVEGLLNDSTEFYLSEIADSIVFIMPEVVEEMLLDKIEKVEIDGDNIFILSMSGQEEYYIYRLNSRGGLINTIGRVGRGPGEYLYCSFSLDYEKKEVLVHRWYAFKDILRFSYNGDFLGRHPVGVIERAMKISVLPQGRIILYNNVWGVVRKDIPDSSTQFDMYDSAGIKQDVVMHPILKVPGNCDGRLSADDFNTGIYRMGNEAYLYARWNDTIYCTKDLSIEPAFILDKGNYNAPMDLRYLKMYKDEYQYLGEYLSANLIVTDRYLFIEQNLGTTKYVFRFDKATGETVSSREESSGRHQIGYHEYKRYPWFTDDLSGSGGWISVLDRTERDGSVLAIPHPVSYFREKFGAREVTEGIGFRQSMLDERLKVIDGLNDDDNPVIVLIYLKN
jgi:hypothetical protein